MFDFYQVVGDGNGTLPGRDVFGSSYRGEGATALVEDEGISLDPDVVGVEISCSAMGNCHTPPATALCVGTEVVPHDAGVLAREVGIEGVGAVFKSIVGDIDGTVKLQSSATP